MNHPRTELLRVVFHLDAMPEGKEFRFGPYRFSKLKETLCTSNTEIIKILMTEFEKNGQNPNFKLPGMTKMVTSDNILNTMLTTDVRDYELVSEQFLFEFPRLTNHGFNYLIATEKTAGALRPWNNWVKPFLDSNLFIQAWIADKDYDYWQNAEDFLQYDAIKRSREGLPTISNGLPYPLERQIIDISNNPGRWSLKEGYIEAVGSTMWLGPRFWEAIGHDRRSELCSEQLLETQILAGGVIRVQASESCFHDDSSRNIQDRLREIIFK